MVLILGLKFNWINDSQSNCFIIVRSPICAMRLIFFPWSFEPASVSRPFSRRLFFVLFCCCCCFFLSTILTISRTIFSFADYITIKSKLACPTNPPLPRLFPLRLPISYPWGSFDPCLCTQADETQPKFPRKVMAFSIVPSTAGYTKRE